MKKKIVKEDDEEIINDAHKALLVLIRRMEITNHGLFWVRWEASEFVDHTYAIRIENMNRKTCCFSVASGVCRDLIDYTYIFM